MAFHGILAGALEFVHFSAILLVCSIEDQGTYEKSMCHESDLMVKLCLTDFWQLFNIVLVLTDYCTHLYCDKYYIFEEFRLGSFQVVTL